MQLTPPRDPLIELRGVVPKRLIQLRMPDEHDLQKLRFVCFEVEEQAQLLQHLGVEILSFVDDEHRASPHGNERCEEMLKSPHQLVARRRTGEGNLSRSIDHAEVGEHVEQQILDRDSGIEHDGRTRARLELLKQRPTQERLAGAGCASHDDEPLPLLQCAPYLVARRHVRLRGVEKPLVERLPEGPLRQSMMLLDDQRGYLSAPNQARHQVT